MLGLEDDEIVDAGDWENDPELLAELDDLGWKDSAVIAGSKGKTSSLPTKSQLSAAKFDSTDPAISSNFGDDTLGDIGLLDDKDIQLTEEDMNDPDLIAAFDVLAEGGSIQTVSSALVDENLVNPQTGSSSQPAQPSRDKIKLAGPQVGEKRDSKSLQPQTADEARKYALRLNKEGNKEEALKWLRHAKDMEAGKVGPVSMTQVSVSRPPVAKGITDTGLSASKDHRSSVRSSVAKGVSEAGSPASKDHRSSAAVVRPAVHTAPAIYPVEKLQQSTNPFDILEGALKSASQAALEEAKNLNSAGQKPQAAEKFREYKKYAQDLDVLNARRSIPGAGVPLFKWTTIKNEVKTEKLDIGEDDIRLIVGKAEGLDGLIDSTSTKYKVNLDFDLGIPKEIPITGQISGTLHKGIIEFDYKAVLQNAFKRSSKMASKTLFERRKVTFRVTLLKKGFFSSTEIYVGTAAFPLKDLLTKCETEANLPFTKEDEKGRAKAVAGSLRAGLALRSPISGPEVKVTEKRVLEVGEWPVEGVHAPPPAAPVPAPAPVAAPLAVAAPVSVAEAEAGPGHRVEQGSSSYPAMVADSGGVSRAGAVAQGVAVSATATATGLPGVVAGGMANQAPAGKEGGLAAGASGAEAMIASRAKLDFSSLNEIETKDPTNVALMLSNDVLEYEIGETTKDVAKARASKDEQAYLLELRLQLLQTKMDLLVRSIQEDKISLPEYLEMLQERVQRDKLLLSYLQSQVHHKLRQHKQQKLSDEDREVIAELRVNASKVMKRVEIMEAEIAGASGVEEDDGEEEEEAGEGSS